MIKHSHFYFVCSNHDENVGEIVGKIFIGKKCILRDKQFYSNTDYYISDTEVPYNILERLPEFNFMNMQMKKAA